MRMAMFGLLSCTIQGFAIEKLTYIAFQLMYGLALTVAVDGAEIISYLNILFLASRLRARDKASDTSPPKNHHCEQTPRISNNPSIGCSEVFVTPGALREVEL